MGHGGSSSCLWGVSAGLGGEGWPAALGDSTACVADGGGRCAGAGLRALLEGRSSGLLPTPLSLRFSSVGIQGRARRDRGAAREGWQQGWGRSSSQCSCGKQTAEGQWGGFGCCQQPDGGASDGHGMRWLGQHTQRGAPRTGGEGLAGTPWQGGVGQTPSQVWGGTWARVAFFCRECGGISAPPQAQPRRLREHSGIRTQPYLSLPRGGLGSVEHLLPPLHARHGFHVLAPVTHFHGAFLREGRGRG